MPPGIGYGRNRGAGRVRRPGRPVRNPSTPVRSRNRRPGRPVSNTARRTRVRGGTTTGMSRMR